MKPSIRPTNPCFSSGPCAKRPGWSFEALDDAVLGHSHRSNLGKSRILEVLSRTRSVLNIPDDFRIAIVPGSDTGAVEMCLWSMLGPRGVDIAGWESFGNGWIFDVVNQLKIEDVRLFQADYGKLPDLSELDCDRDIVFTWNGTTSGVCVPTAEWISDNRKGITICDATSAVFAMELLWSKLDVVTYSWQKVMGGEAAHGMIVLSPRAVERLQSYEPTWPIPKLFRLAKDGNINESLFTGDTLNTPSMMCVEDAIDGLKWAESIGGLSELIARSRSNLTCFEKWVQDSEWIDFLAENPDNRSSTSICFRIIDNWFNRLSESDQRTKINGIVDVLASEKVAYDIGAYRDAPPGFRVWGGATVESEDIESLIPWLDWGWEKIVST